MKLYAVAKSIEGLDRRKTGAYHAWQEPSGHYLLICLPRTASDYDAAAAHLESIGASVFPELLGRGTVGALASHPAFAGSGLDPSHPTYEAMKILKDHFRWPALDPRT